MADLRPGVQIIAQCRTCLSSRYIRSENDLPDAVRHLELRLIEARMRCRDRGRDRRGPPCGGRAEFQVFIPDEMRGLRGVGPLLPRHGA